MFFCTSATSTSHFHHYLREYMPVADIQVVPSVGAACLVYRLQQRYRQFVAADGDVESTVVRVPLSHPFYFAPFGEGVGDVVALIVQRADGLVPLGQSGGFGVGLCIGYDGTRYLVAVLDEVLHAEVVEHFVLPESVCAGREGMNTVRGDRLL